MIECCVLCGAIHKPFQYNLHNTYPRANTSLKTVLEFLKEFIEKTEDQQNICDCCYNLVIELDAIEVRAKEIKQKLTEYAQNRSKVQQNIIKVENTNIFSCKCCTQNFNCKLSLELHVNDEHCLDVMCGNDTNVINTTENINNEINIQTGILEDVSDVQIKEENKYKNATIIDKTNETVSTKKRGRKKKDPDLITYHKCHCSKEFKTVGELKKHMSTHSTHRPYICEICGQGYKHRNAFNIHMGIHNGVNPFMCCFCNKSFTQKGALLRHERIHTGEMPYQCDICGKRFKHHTSFNVHKLSHSGQKSYKCEHCGLALMSASHLNRHTKIHTGEKKFACSSCGKRFAERYNLLVHQKLHNNLNSTKIHERKYRCQLCSKTFERKVKLEDHLIQEHQKLSRDEPNDMFMKNEIIYQSEELENII